MKRLAMLLVGVILTTPVAAQSRVIRGVAIGGAAGAAAGGALGALFGQGLCDAADCDGAWIDGAVPGAVFGGFAGAAVGGMIGALLRGGGESAGSGPPEQPRFGALLDVSTARAEWNSIDQSVTGIRGMVGARLGNVLVGPSIERVSGGGWGMTGIGVAGRLDAGAGTIRPYLEASAGHFRWKNPAILGQCSPAPPSCTYAPGTLTDGYLGGAGAVGVSAGDRRGAWRVYGQVRFHWAPDRPAGEPFSTTSRQLRQLSVGASIGIR